MNFPSFSRDLSRHATRFWRCGTAALSAAAFLVLSLTRTSELYAEDIRTLTPLLGSSQSGSSASKGGTDFQPVSGNAAGNQRMSWLDRELFRILRRDGVAAISEAPPQNPQMVKLGRKLFFDRILSGNGDTSCATCHHPVLGTGDELALSVGTGAENPGAIGIFRQKRASSHFIPRNAPEIFNRGAEQWHTQFWDVRVAEAYNGFQSPAGEQLPEGLNGVLAVQAMFPVTSGDEMRGTVEDAGREFTYGTFQITNDIAGIDNSDLTAIWARLTERLLSIAEYRTLFSAAYGISDANLDDEIGFQHAANAIAAFEIKAFTFTDSPWDEYLNGNLRALSDRQKRGAYVLYGRAGCSSCHSGTLLTDQKPHNILVPEIGPGKTAEGDDQGVVLVSGDPADEYCFRTPPLRNVAVTGPWLHNGAYNSLEDVILHHLSPWKSFLQYNPEDSLEQPELRESVDHSGLLLSTMMLTFSWEMLPSSRITREDVRDLEAFLHALTAPNLRQRLQMQIPYSVPSGLPVDGQ